MPEKMAKMAVPKIVLKNYIKHNYINKNYINFFCEKMAEKMETKLTYEIYSVKSYKNADIEFIKNKKITLDSLQNLTSELRHDNYYHFRIHKNTNYIFFGDIDNYDGKITQFIDILQQFMKEKYNLLFDSDEFKYTQNNNKKGSYHYSIPKWYASTEKLKEIHSNLLNLKKSDFKTKINKKIITNIDTTIYSEHWFRCPNQSKGNDDINNNKHIIVHGIMNDFIINYIPLNSININNINYDGNLIIEKKIKPETIKIKTEKLNTILTTFNSNIPTLIGSTKITEKNICLTSTFNDINLIMCLFDNCYSSYRFDDYHSWISVGMALMYSMQNKEDALFLFNYYSSKGLKYKGIEQTKLKFMSFVTNSNDNGYTMATIYYYALEDNREKFKEILNKNTFNLGSTDICKYLHVIAGYKFIYVGHNDFYKLYSYNGKFWEQNTLIFKQFITSDLYNFLKMILTELYWNSKDFIALRSRIEKLKQLSFKNELIETYKEYGLNNDIVFDDKWWLFGFKNQVYDMKLQSFRPYNLYDYVSITTQYDWREPTDDEMSTMHKLLSLIMPIPEELDAYLQILSTAIDGRPLEKFCIQSGFGGNGKGMINDLMLVMLGGYGMTGNNSILFEPSKSGSNPEKANLHKKRYVIFREPPEKKKFENSIIKELTGGGYISARGLYETSCSKELNLTMVVECNTKPLFSEEPTNADVRRIIDIYFRSTFVTDPSLVDPSKYIYLADPIYKTPHFQHTHKFALFKILANKHSQYLKQNSILVLPTSIQQRTQAYLELSFNLVQWFKDTYQQSSDKSSFLKIKDIYHSFTQSPSYNKKQYTYSKFLDYITTNIFFKQFYSERYNNLRHVLKSWTIIPSISYDDDSS